ncbi:hypothetical protein VIGAN_05276600 [Vigna angularis var. angularis]|uniref:Uncharacterized protein n=1 Tax=Vigna angularis var. angularis TaxID=157739 RepID=A0A0S3S8F0_PHAAN|nr:hypothetical protein VIGAN_05276600 [Vigna angularis var. angularis]
MRFQFPVKMLKHSSSRRKCCESKFQRLITTNLQLSSPPIYNCRALLAPRERSSLSILRNSATHKEKERKNGLATLSPCSQRHR